MPQGFLATLISLFFFFSGSLGGSSPQDSTSLPPPAQSSDFLWLGGSQQQDSTMALISSEKANLRTGPGTNYPLAATLPKGTMVFVQTSRNSWLKVSLPDGRSGWLASSLVKTSGAGNLTQPNPKMSPVEIIGYYTKDHPTDDDSYQSLKSYSSYMTGISPFFFGVDSFGNVSGKNYSTPVSLAKSRGLKALALIHNSTGNGFSGDVAHNLLVYPSRRARAVSNILNLLRAYGYDGVNIDFENLYPMDRPYFSAFIKELAMALKPKGYLVTISVPAKTKENYSSRWGGAFDYRTLGEYSDMVMLMTYDEHYRNGPPGPVASYSWVEKVINYARSQIPSSKIVLGLASYGYDWPVKGGSARSLSYRQILDLAKKYGKTPQWSNSAKVPYLNYVKNGVKRIIWFESSYSIEQKVALVKKYGLRGVAMWKMGYEDSRTWQVLSQLRS